MHRWHSVTLSAAASRLISRIGTKQRAKEREWESPDQRGNAKRHHHAGYSIANRLGAHFLVRSEHVITYRRTHDADACPMGNLGDHCRLADVGSYDGCYDATFSHPDDFGSQTRRDETGPGIPRLPSLVPDCVSPDLGSVQPLRFVSAMELSESRCPFAYVEDSRLDDRWRHNYRSGALSAYADQGRMPPKMPVSNGFRINRLALGASGRLSDGAQARPILHWLLLGLDDGLVRRWRHELDHHRSLVRNRRNRKTGTPRANILKTRWRPIDRLGPVADFRDDRTTSTICLVRRDKCEGHEWTQSRHLPPDTQSSEKKAPSLACGAFELVCEI